MSMPLRIGLVVGSLSLALVACSSQSGGRTIGKGRDASGADGGADSGDTGGDGGSKDARADAAPCPSIGEACVDGGAAAGQCVESWSSAQQPSTWCPKYPYARVIRATRCDGFDIVVIGAADSSSFYYYDPQSGALVGIEGHGQLGTMCIAGQSPDVPLTDCYEAGAAVTVFCQIDGSVSD